MDNGSPPVDSSLSDQEMRDCINAEVEEIMKYKWYMGERLKHDPLQDRTMNDICKEWIEKHAADFRKSWQSRRKSN